MNYKDMSFTEFFTEAVFRSTMAGKEKFTIAGFICKMFDFWLLNISFTHGPGNHFEFDPKKLKTEELGQKCQAMGLNFLSDLVWVDENKERPFLVSIAPGAPTSFAYAFGDSKRIEEFEQLIEPYKPSETNSTMAVLGFDDSTNKALTFLSDLKHNTQKPILATSYPYLDRSIEELAQAFMASSSRLLLLYGPPGTGKTNYLSKLIQLTTGSATVCSDPKVLADRRLYIDFLRSTKRKLLVLEDADILVEAREAGNQIMSLLLNILDGLMTTDKRMIISTNLPNLKKIDEALIRPGRCFDALQFKKLTTQQALEARCSLELPEIALEGQSEWALSEIINYELIRNLAAHRRTEIGYV